MLTTIPQYRSLNASSASSSFNTKTTDPYTTAFSSKSPTTDSNGEINSNYLIIGVGALLAVLLLVIIIQKCLKTNSTRGNVSSRKSNESNMPPDSSDADKKKYGKLYQSGNKDHLYRRMESDYQEIDECLEMVNMIDKQVKSQDSSLHPETNDSYLSPVAGSDDFVEPETQQGYIEPQNLLPRLHSPRIPVGRKHSTDKGPHSYIKVIEVDDVSSHVNRKLENPDGIHRPSSSYDDVMWESPTASGKMDEEKDNYIDAVFQ
jgi:hypothetical protein